MSFERSTIRDPRLPADPFVPYLEPLFSTARFDISGRGTVFHIKMPIACERAMAGPCGVLAALGGNPVTIDGEKWDIRAVEMFRPAYPIYPGEGIGLVVRPWAGARAVSACALA